MANNTTVPIDRGWAWVIVAAAFLNLATLIGISRAFGMIFAEMIDLYHGMASETSIMLSLSTGLSLFIGPIVTTLCDMYTCRTISMIGGIICSLGFLVPAFCTSLEQIIISFGILTGFGYGFALVPAALMVGQYFERRRSLANGLMFSGSGLGGMLIPLFVNIIIPLFGLHGAFMILSGVALETVVFSSLYRPLKYWKRSRNQSIEDEGIQVQLDVNNLEEINMCNRRRLSSPNIPRAKFQHSSISQLSEHPLDDYRDTVGASKATLYFSALNLSSWISVPEIYHMNVTYCDNSTQTQNEDMSSETRDKYFGHNRLSRIFKRICYVKAADGTSLSLFDLRLFKDLRFTLFAICCTFVLTIVFVGMIIPAHCQDLGMTKTQVAILLSIQGGADTAGRLFSGLVGDRSCIRDRRKLIACIYCFICASSTFISVFLTTFWLMAGYLILSSFVSGAFIATIPVVLVELVGIENLSRAWGLTMFLEGFSLTLTPLMIGLLKDWTLTYNSGLIFIASCFVIATICMIIITIQTYRKVPNNDNDS